MKYFLNEIRKAIIARFAIVLVGLVVVVGIALYLTRLLRDNEVTVSHTSRIGITPVQVESIRRIGQWEFLSIADEELVDTVRRGFWGDSELARIYYGTLRLGIDLNQAKDGWITMDQDTVVVILPAIRLLDDNFLDEARTKTFYEDGKWTEADKASLTQRARMAMKRRCLTRENIYNAEQNAISQFEVILYVMGFQHTRISF